MNMEVSQILYGRYLFVFFPIILHEQYCMDSCIILTPITTILFTNHMYNIGHEH